MDTRRINTTLVIGMVLSLLVLLIAAGCSGGGTAPPIPNPNPGATPAPNPGANPGPAQSPDLDGSKITASNDGTLFLVVGEVGAAEGLAQVLIRDQHGHTISTFATADGRIGVTGAEAPPGFDTAAMTTLQVSQIVAGYAESNAIQVTILIAWTPPPGGFNP